MFSYSHRASPAQPMWKICRFSEILSVTAGSSMESPRVGVKSPRSGRYRPVSTDKRGEVAPLELDVEGGSYGSRLGRSSSFQFHPTPSKMMVVLPVVISQLFERVAFYGLQGNMALFLTRVAQLPVGDADVQVGLWTGVCYMTPMVGGYVADSYFGRWKAMLLFFSVYLVGMILLVVAAFMPTPTSSAAVFFPAVYIVAAGSGALKPLVSTFGKLFSSLSPTFGQ